MGTKKVIPQSKLSSAKGSIPKTPVTVRKNRNESYNKLYILIPLLLTIIVYSGSLNNGWIKNWDDGGYVTEGGSNNFLSAKSIHTLKGEQIKEVFTEFYKGNYHPLTTLFYAIEYRLVGDNTFLYHFNNLFFHLLNVFLVFIFLKLLTRRIEIAAIAAALFGIHPMHVESVAWISERKDVLYTFFFLISMIQYFYYYTRKEKKVRYYIFSLVAFFLSMMSKSAAVTLPVVLLLIDYYLKREWSWKMLYEKIPFFLLALAFGLTAIFSQDKAGAIQDITPLFSFFERLLLSSGATLTYIWKLFVPIDLVCMFPYPNRIAGHLPLFYYLAPIVLLLLAFLIYFSKKYNRDIIFGSLFFIVTISLVLQILPVGGALLAERYTYVPYIGFFLILGKGYIFSQESQNTFLKKIKILFPVILIAGTIVLSVMSYQRIEKWKDGKILFTDLISKYPNLPFAFSNRGYFNFSFGEEYYAKEYKKFGYPDAKAMAYDSALADYNKCLSADSTFHRGYSNRGVLYFNLAENSKKNGTITNQVKLDSIYQLAALDFTKALNYSGDNTDALIGRANTYSTLKNFKLALPDYDKYMLTIKNDAKAYIWRGTANFNLGNYKQAFNDFNTAVKLEPKNENALMWRGVSYYQEKNYQAAIADLSQSIKLNPDKSEPYSWRGLAYYGLKQLENAVNDYTQAITLNPNDAVSFVNRSQANYELGNYKQAFKDQCSAGDLHYALNKDFFFKLEALARK